jgi:hypothetical protein
MRENFAIQHKVKENLFCKIQLIITLNTDKSQSERVKAKLKKRFTFFFLSLFCIVEGKKAAIVIRSRERKQFSSRHQQDNLK